MKCCRDAHGCKSHSSVGTKCHYLIQTNLISWSCFKRKIITTWSSGWHTYIHHGYRNSADSLAERIRLTLHSDSHSGFTLLLLWLLLNSVGKIAFNQLVFLFIWCHNALIASWVRAIQFSFDSLSVTFWTSTTPFSSRESWTQATLISAGRLKRSWVKFNLTSYGRSNHADTSAISVFLRFYFWLFDSGTGRAVLIISPLHNQHLTHAGIVCIFSCPILSLFHVQTQSSFTWRSTWLGRIWDPYFLTSHILSVVPLEHALEMLWGYTSIPLVQASLHN